MNFQYFLDERLKFVLFLYDSTVPQFEEIKRKIGAEEPPYNYSRHPDDESGEPMYQEEWEQADLGADVLGMTCLEQVQKVLHTFLRDFTEWSFGKKALDEVSRMKQKSWLANFRAFYARDPDFDWGNGGADLGLLEEMVLTRNDFQHSSEMLSPFTYQDDKHKEKYPESSFRHPTWSAMLLGRTRLYITRERLEAAIDAVRSLAKYLEDALQVANRKASRDRSNG